MFIRRVYQILTLQLVFTFVMIFGLCTWVDSHYSNPISSPDATLVDGVLQNDLDTVVSIESPASRFYAEQSGLISLLTMTSLMGTFGTLIALHFVQKQFPLNLVVLGLFTLCESVILSIGLLAFEKGLIIQAGEITVTVFVGLTLYTIYSKEDYSWMGSYLFTGLWVLIFGGFLLWFFPLPNVFDILYSWGGALLFSMFIIYDTWRLHHQLKVDEYVVACINLYLDFINLFLKILRILSKKK